MPVAQGSDIADRVAGFAWLWQIDRAELATQIRDAVDSGMSRVRRSSEDSIAEAAEAAAETVTEEADTAATDSAPERLASTMSGIHATLRSSLIELSTPRKPSPTLRM